MSLWRRGRPRRAAARRSSRRGLVIMTLGILVTGAWMLNRNGLSLHNLVWPARRGGEICQVDRVFDGDSLRVLCSDGPVEVRLHCIDAPERDQVPWAKQSRRHLREAASRGVELVPVDKDRFGRLVAEVYGVAPARPLLNLEQVAGGHAAVYRRYCNDPRYDDAEREAREAKRGIWSRPGDQQTPWLFRAQQRR